MINKEKLMYVAGVLVLICLLLMYISIERKNHRNSIEVMCNYNDDITKQLIRKREDSKEAYYALTVINENLIKTNNLLLDSLVIMQNSNNIYLDSLQNIESKVKLMDDDVVISYVADIMKKRLPKDTSKSAVYISISESREIIKMNDSLNLLVSISDNQKTIISNLNTTNNNLDSLLFNKDEQLQLINDKHVADSTIMDVVYNVEVAKKKRIRRQRNILAVVSIAILVLFAR